MSERTQGLAGMLALLALTTTALFLLALVDRPAELPAIARESDAHPAARLNSDRLLDIAIKRIPTVAKRVERIRGIRFDRVPEPKISEAADRLRLAERELKKPKVRRMLREEEVQLRLLGLLDEDENLGQVAKDSTGLASAFYDPSKKGTLFLVGDAVPAGPALTEFLLAHELTHALEDQRFGLRASSQVTGDSSLAQGALHEGTASAVMQIYAARHLDGMDLAAESQGIESGDVELPKFAAAQIQFTYGAGARFVALLREYAKGWGLVNYAYTKQKLSTTEQIMHSEKYIAGEEAVKVEVPAPRTGWTRTDGGTIGEWATRQLINEGEETVRGSIAAAGWGGDRYALFRRKGAKGQCAAACLRDHAMTLHWRYDSASEAEELDQELEVYVEKALDGDPTGVRWRLDGGWASIVRSGDRVGLGMAPSQTLADRLAQPGL